MTARQVAWEGKPFALLVETDEGDFLVPPIVLDDAGNVVEGRETRENLEYVVQSGVEIGLPVVHGANPGTMAEVDQRMALISKQLGIPTLAQRLGSNEWLPQEPPGEPSAE